MKVFKFGGASVKDAQGVINVKNIISLYKNEELTVVISAMGKTTNLMEEILMFWYSDKTKMMEKFNIKCIAVESSEKAIENADIITSVTTTKNPVFDGRLVKKGAHINGVGSYTPEMHEIDEYTVLNAGKVYVDTRDGVLSESADLINPIKNNKCTEAIVTGELGELLLGKTKGRESSDEITFFKTVGTAVLDIVTAKMIYIKALELNIGDIVEM